LKFRDKNSQISQIFVDQNAINGNDQTNSSYIAVA